MTKKTIILPDLAFENAIDGPVFGVDEVGRGPLAGPVMAGAALLNKEDIPVGINDSKKLTFRRRQLLSDQLHEHAVYATALVDVADIDRINIRQASLLAMKRAVKALITKTGIKPACILVDGCDLPDWPWPSQTIIGGDRLSLSIAAASVLAKVERDHLMIEESQRWPGYGWEHNMGYGTKQHRDAIWTLGPTPLHRCSFSPIRDYLEQKSR
ncbi:MAG: ribonuclease HII [Zymomonas mobilis subsp. pomaceae]|nr:ribonuclease HII [Zymomonas mobilis]MDX5948547.1 ribonuclease HII [Zymomonas mobilis subsp. pomaceae]